ncbi:transcriptional regulator with XRE-family HTH domain [Janthinobacterium sp. CG_23.3]|uniref:helix-turn-helix domain-containing protein n=1 Tax=Janthinobacterium sp. CG_23.3 TaxID=3349634 RepID=UPI0038D50837
MSIRLKLLRKQKAWSLEALAERTELTKSYLSKVERGLSVPSIAVAIKLSRALDVDLEELFSDQVSPTEISITRASERTSLSAAQTDKPSVQSIASGAASKRMLPFVVYPPSEFVASAFKEHEGEELLFVHKGAIEVAFPTGNVELQAGDSLYFNALIPHKTRSIGPVQAEVLVVVSHEDD